MPEQRPGGRLDYGPIGPNGIRPLIGMHGGSPITIAALDPGGPWRFTPATAQAANAAAAGGPYRVISVTEQTEARWRELHAEAARVHPALTAPWARERGQQLTVTRQELATRPWWRSLDRLAATWEATMLLYDPLAPIDDAIARRLEAFAQRHGATVRVMLFTDWIWPETT